MFKSIKNRHFWRVLVLLLAFCNVTNAEEISKEYRIKAAILIKLVQFFWWEESSFGGDTHTINFCLLQPDPFAEFIDDIVKKKNSTSKSRSLNILRVDNHPDEILSCHVLFISQQSEQLIQPYPENLLLISENSVLSNSDMHLNIFTVDNKIKFEVNVDNIRNSNIHINSQLLKVAKVVKNNKGADLP